MSEVIDPVVIGLANIHSQLLECYALRQRLEAQLFSHPEYGDVLRQGMSIEAAGYKVKGQRIKPEQVSPIEKRRLPETRDGFFIKLKITKVEEE